MADEVRNTQTTIEVLREATDQVGRVTQTVVEVMREATGQMGRVTQTVVEVMREDPGNTYYERGQFFQLSVEVLSLDPINVGNPPQLLVIT